MKLINAKPLAKLYEAINTSNISYLTNQPILIEENNSLQSINSLEHLVISGPAEQFSLSTFPNQPTLARYTGINSKEMITTIKALKLPRNHNNYAHFTFKFFNKHLQNHTGAAVINKAVPQQKESHFKDLLRRLDTIYNNQAISHEPYATRLNEY